MQEFPLLGGDHECLAIPASTACDLPGPVSTTESPIHFQAGAVRKLRTFLHLACRCRSNSILSISGLLHTLLIDSKLVLSSP
jgi:hypothetical protein